jgi:hypothetical protein
MVVVVVVAVVTKAGKKFHVINALYTRHIEVYL